MSGLANEIRWVDEEGLKARLEAEADLRTRVAAIATRVDDMEEVFSAAVAASLNGGCARRDLGHVHPVVAVWWHAVYLCACVRACV